LAAQAISIGFRGGQAVSARVGAEELERLRAALRAPDSTARWHQLRDEDGTLELDLQAVLYVRTESDEHHVGFRA
jgi:hypothetical protein